MKGVQFVVNEEGEKTAVVIDLKRHAALWEDIYDAAVARERQYEFRETFLAQGPRPSGSRKLQKFLVRSSVGMNGGYANNFS